MDTLPDYLCPGLEIVFLGVDPGTYSARMGHQTGKTQEPSRCGSFWTFSQALALPYWESSSGAATSSSRRRSFQGSGSIQ